VGGRRAAAGRLYLLADEGEALLAAAGIWTAILVIDFVVSFSASVPGSSNVNCGWVGER
jgi:hypothetical protein